MRICAHNSRWVEFAQAAHSLGVAAETGPENGRKLVRIFFDFFAFFLVFLRFFVIFFIFFARFSPGFALFPRFSPDFCVCCARNTKTIGAQRALRLRVRVGMGL